MTKLVRKFRTYLRNIKRRIRKVKTLHVLAGIFTIGATAYIIGSMNRSLVVDPETCQPLLELIAQAESRGNYNAYFGNASNDKLNFTDMSVAEVLKWQNDFIASGSPSSAVGRYQIINTTLNNLVQQLDLDTSLKFDEVVQDGLAMALLNKRGANDYLNSRLNKEQFAAELAKEWASLPSVLGDNPGQSYYAGDGLNRALIGVNEVLVAIEQIEAIDPITR